MATINQIDKLNFIYEVSNKGKISFIDLSFSLLIAGAFSDKASVGARDYNVYQVPNEEINHFIKLLDIKITLDVPNYLYPRRIKNLSVTVPIVALNDFSLERLLVNVECLRRAYRLLAKLKFMFSKGQDYTALLDNLDHLMFFDLSADDIGSLEKFEFVIMLDDFEKRIFQQLNIIIRQDKFRTIESNWHVLGNLSDLISNSKHCYINILDISKEALVNDCTSCDSYEDTHLHKCVYEKEFGQFGGVPYAAIVAAYDFSPQSDDIETLGVIANVAGASHAPFIASASPQMWQMSSYREFFDLDQIKKGNKFSQLEQKWKTFASKDAAKYIFLTVPRIKVRDAYHYGKNDTDGLPFIEEIIEGDSILWSSGSFCIAESLLNSFIKYHSGLGVAEEHGGESSIGLPELWLAYEAVVAFADNGFIPLFYDKIRNKVTLYTLPSVHYLCFDRNNRKVTDNVGLELMEQLPYLMMISRIVHYLKVIQRDTIGTYDPAVVKDILSKWLHKYVSNMDKPNDNIRIKKPLRRAELDIFAGKGNDQFSLGLSLKITPHMKYYGKEYTLFLEGGLS